MLIKGDCEKLLSYIPNDAVIVTDPPYGLPREDFLKVLRVLKALSHLPQIVILDWRNSHLMSELPKCGELIWEYGWVSGGRTRARTGIFPTHNTIHLIGDKSRFRFVNGSIIKRAPGFSSPRHCSFANKSGHPHEKPVKLMRFLLEGIIDPGTIVDIFAGSGSTLVAAEQLALPWVGIEESATWYEVARKRLNLSKAE